MQLQSPKNNPTESQADRDIHINIEFYLEKFSQKLRKFHRMLESTESQSIWDSRKFKYLAAESTSDQTETSDADILTKAASILINFQEFEYLLKQKQEESLNLKSEVQNLIGKMVIQQEQMLTSFKVSGDNETTGRELISSLLTVSLRGNGLNLDQIQTVNIFLDSISSPKSNKGHSEEEHEKCLEHFIEQVGDLREQIERLAEENQILKLQLLNKRREIFSKYNLENPEISQGPEVGVEKMYVERLNQEIKSKDRQIGTLQRQVGRKSLIIKQLNADFKVEINRYNQVFAKLRAEILGLNSYLDWNAIDHIEHLEREVNLLKGQLDTTAQSTKFMGYQMKPQAALSHRFATDCFLPPKSSRWESDSRLGPTYFRNRSRLSEYSKDSMRSRSSRRLACNPLKRSTLSPRY